MVEHRCVDKDVSNHKAGQRQVSLLYIEALPKTHIPFTQNPALSTTKEPHRTIPSPGCN